jgi:hypothetical protein
VKWRIPQALLQYKKTITLQEEINAAPDLIIQLSSSKLKTKTIYGEK